MKEFGKRLKELRLINKLTLKQLAEKIGVTAVALLQCEKGYYAIKISKIIELAKVFNVSMDYLLGMIE